MKNYKNEFFQYIKIQFYDVILKFYTFFRYFLLNYMVDVLIKVEFNNIMNIYNRETFLNEKNIFRLYQGGTYGKQET